MTVNDLIKQCQIRLEYLKTIKNSNIQLNNTDIVNKIDSEILECQDTITKLDSIKEA